MKYRSLVMKSLARFITGTIKLKGSSSGKGSRKRVYKKPKPQYMSEPKNTYLNKHNPKQKFNKYFSRNIYKRIKKS